MTDDPTDPGTDAATDAVANDRANPALAALAAAGIDHAVTRHGRVRSLAEAAAARGISPRDLVKTMVVRVTTDDHRFVLLPGDRSIDWARLRALLGVSRMTMADQDEARRLTGYERGTITPFGSRTPLGVIVDERIVGRTISMGMGEHGAGVTVAADEVIAALDATVADISST